MEKELPIGWVETELHVVSEILDNLRKPVNSTERGGRIGNIPYYGATGQAGWIDDYLFDEELVLVGEDGAPFFDKTKNVAYLINGKSWVNNHAHVLKAINKISLNKFLLHFLNQFDYKDFVGGTTRLKLTQGDLKIVPVPLPPLPEQQRMVAKLDTLFGHLDALKTRLDRIPQLLKEFRQKVLTQAVTGKLTEEWREGRELENEYDTDFMANMRDATIEIPELWYWLPFESIATIKSNLVDPNKYLEYPLIAPDNIQSETGLLINKPLVSDIMPISSKHIFEKGSIVYSKIRPYLSKLVIVDFDGLCSADMYPIISDLETRYLFYYMLSEHFLSYATTAGERTVLPKINQKGLNEIPVPVPPIEEQQEIVRRVESLFAKADQIEAGYQKLKAKIEQLPQALLAKAFRGELVGQLPTDGDARDLLEQIKQAKAGLGKGGKTKKMKENDKVRMVAEEETRYGKK